MVSAVLEPNSNNAATANELEPGFGPGFGPEFVRVSSRIGQPDSCWWAAHALALIGVIHNDIAVESTSRCPAAFHCDPTRLDDSDEIIHDFICEALQRIGHYTDQERA